VILRKNGKNLKKTNEDKYLRMEDLTYLTPYQRLIVEAKLSCGAWKPYRMNYILSDGKPILKSKIGKTKK
jgi:hypothetical protein